jgi:hypothetical protein
MNPIKPLGVKANALGGLAVPALLVTLVVLLLNDKNNIRYGNPVEHQYT